MIIDRTIISFGLITCCISWLVWSCLLFRTSIGRLLIDLESDPTLILIMIIGGIIPSIVGLSFVESSLKTYLKETFSISKLLNLPSICWISLSIPVVANLLLFLAMHSIFPLKVHLLDIVKERIFPGLVMGVCASLGEEFGWRGCVLFNLIKTNKPKEKSEIIKIGIIVGIMWSIWHSFGNYIALGHYQSVSLIIFMNAFINLTNYSIILSMLYVKSGGCMLLEIIFHSMISFSSFTFNHNNTSEREQLVESFLGCLFSFIGMLFIVKLIQLPSPLR